tara:strand:- start:5110 stop:5481 length:372 start_codon:yes stop_codon:yes gene_type:complete
MKTQIERKLKRKTDKELVGTIIAGKKKDSWNLVSMKISKPNRKQTDLNLDEIDSRSEEGDVVVVPGKVLGLGEIKKKIKISALAYSESAKKKLTEDGIEFNLIGEEIKKNPEAKDVRILEREE